MNFQGTTYEAQHDELRLTSQYERILNWMLDHGEFRTLREIVEACGGTESSASARLRDFRKPVNGGYRVERRRCGIPAEGIFEYQVLKPGYLL